MEIRLFSVGEKRLLENRIANYAGYYMWYMQSEERWDYEKENPSFIFIHTFGEIALLYLKTVARIIIKRNLEF